MGISGLALCLALVAGADEPEGDLPPGWTRAGPAAKPAADEGLSRWYPMGIAGGAALGASLGAPLYYFAATSNGSGSSSCSGAICAIAGLGGLGVGLVVGGVLGWRLGKLASDEATWAKVLIVVFDIVGLPITAMSYLGVALATGNGPRGIP